MDAGFDFDKFEVHKHVWELVCELESEDGNTVLLIELCSCNEVRESHQVGNEPARINIHPVICQLPEESA